jgi:hypothetical protein
MERSCWTETILGSTQGHERAFHFATTFHGSALLPFVISTEAQRRGEISMWMLFLGKFCFSLSGNDVIRPHHFVGGVLQRMTVPKKSTCVAVETHNDPGNAARLHPHGIFPASLVRCGGDGWPAEAQRLRR